MEQLGDFHNFERQYCPSVENISSIAIQSLDSVRALHQTTVSLRQALEEAHREIENLKKQIRISSDIEAGKTYREQYTQQLPETTSVRTAEDFKELRKDILSDAVRVKFITNEEEKKIPVEEQDKKIESSEEEEEENDEKEEENSRIVKNTSVFEKKYQICDEIKLKSPSAHKSLKYMASQIDVKIKLSSNINVECGDTESSADVTDNASTATNTPREPHTTSPDVDAEPTAQNEKTVDVDKAEQVAETHESSKESILDTNTHVEGESEDDCVFVDNASVHSSCDGIATPAEQGEVTTRDQSEQISTFDNQEEVDDIELIFSSDDKDFPQEELVSISYYEPWHICGRSGTPVLVHFGSIKSDAESTEAGANENRECCVSPLSLGHRRRATEDSTKRLQTKSCSLENESESKENATRGMCREQSADSFEQAAFSSTIGRRWTNYNVFMHTDISKVGIAEESGSDKTRRNTCPNSSVYRPIIHREALGRHLSPASTRCPLAVKFSYNPRTQHGLSSDHSSRTTSVGPSKLGSKRHSAAQTEISALPAHWQSESRLMPTISHHGLFTLPSKFVPRSGISTYNNALKVSEKTRDTRRILLSDINFTSMVPELSRSADHLCHGDDARNIEGNLEAISEIGGKEAFLKTPECSQRGLTPSMSLTSTGISRWTLNENSFDSQTTQTDNCSSIHHGDSFDSYKDYSKGSKNFQSFDKPNRSRSCPSVQCALCKQRAQGDIKTSESMQYTPRVTFQDGTKASIVRGSLPDLRNDCLCSRHRRSQAIRHVDSCCSSESLLEETEDYLRQSSEGVATSHAGSGATKLPNRQFSENDLNKGFFPTKENLPFLPKTSKCLKPGHFAKVIAKNGRVVIGRVRYVGPLASVSSTATNVDTETYVGLQLATKIGDCNGLYEGRKFFDCEPQQGIFVPFNKIVMAWTS